MNNSDNPDLTHDDHKEIATDMLKGTKDLVPFTFKILGEGIQNKTKSLDNIRCTLVWLHFLGLSYYYGNFADRGRYESLISPFSIYFEMILTKIRELDLHQVAEMMLKNRDKVVKYLEQNNWSKSEMTESHITTSIINSTNGVCIQTKYGRVDIGHSDHNGFVGKPRIFCNAETFEI